MTLVYCAGFAGQARRSARKLRGHLHDLGPATRGRDAFRGEGYWRLAGRACRAGIAVTGSQAMVRTAITPMGYIGRIRPRRCGSCPVVAPVLGFATREDPDKLHDFAPLIGRIAGKDRAFHTMLDMIPENRALNLLERGPYCLDLVDHVDAIAVLRDHARDAANLALDAAQPYSGGFLDWPSHPPKYIPVIGMRPGHGGLCG